MLVPRHVLSFPTTGTQSLEHLLIGRVLERTAVLGVAWRERNASEVVLDRADSFFGDLYLWLHRVRVGWAAYLASFAASRQTR